MKLPKKNTKKVTEPYMVLPAQQKWRHFSSSVLLETLKFSLFFIRPEECKFAYFCPLSVPGTPFGSEIRRRQRRETPGESSLFCLAALSSSLGG